MHIERTIYQTDDTLPGILRWFAIISTDQQVLRPIEVAVDAMQTKNSQLKRLISQYADNTAPTGSINPLTMSLNGVVDPAVMGGIAKYQEVCW